MRVIFIAAQSLDGFITRHDLPGTEFVSKADQHYFRAALAGFDCSVMGGASYRISRDAIRARGDTGRLQLIMTRTPEDYAAESVPGVIEFSSASPAEMLEDLRARGLQRCALLGGGQIYGLFLNTQLIDELWLTVEPQLFGRGTPLLGGCLTDTQLKLQNCEHLSPDTLLLKYEILRK